MIKETFDVQGNPITPVAQFTFMLDGSRTAVNDGSGHARFDNVSFGTHTVTENLPFSWTQVSVTPAGGMVSVFAGVENCAVVIFKNRQTITPPPPPAAPPPPPPPPPPCYNCYPPPPPHNFYCTLNAYPTGLVPIGTHVSLSWTSYGAVRAFLSEFGNVAPSGNLNVPVHSARTFVLTVYDEFGRSATCQAAVNVLIPVTPQYPVIYPPQPQVLLSQIALSEIPYTGFDLGPWGNAMYWLALLMFAGSGAYLVIYGTPRATRRLKGTINAWALGIDRRLGLRN